MCIRDRGGNNASELINYFDLISYFETDASHQYEGSNTVLKHKAREFVLERIIGKED